MAQHFAEIQDKLAQARDRVTSANRRLGLPPDDQAEHLQLPAGVSEEVLRGETQPQPAPPR